MWVIYFLKYEFISLGKKAKTKMIYIYIHTHGSIHVILNFKFYLVNIKENCESYAIYDNFFLIY